MSPICRTPFSLSFTRSTYAFCSTRWLILGISLLGFVNLGWAQAPAVQPDGSATFVKMTPNQLRADLKVVAGRSYAYYGFNTPEIQLHLPFVNNSSFSSFQLPEPKLVDAKGNNVNYEPERGLHDIDNQTVEIRFLAEDGKSPAQFARAIGEITGTYALSIKTIKLSSKDSDKRVRMKSDKVEILKGTLPELPPFSKLQPLRAFNKAGTLLEKKSTYVTNIEGDQTWEVFGFEGTVARIELDTITQAAKVHIRYDIPIRAPLPKSQLAQAPKDERAVKVDPKSDIDIQVDLIEPAKPKPKVAPKPKPKAKKAKPDSKPKVAKKRGEKVPIVPKSALSADARTLANSLEAFMQVVPQPLAIVQLVVPDVLNMDIFLDTGKEVKGWSWQNGTVTGPRIVDTQWLQCKQGMAADAITIARLPALYDDAQKRIPNAGKPLQITVAQWPCGTAFVNIPFEGGSSVLYTGDGYFDKLQ